MDLNLFDLCSHSIYHELRNHEEAMHAMCLIFDILSSISRTGYTLQQIIVSSSAGRADDLDGEKKAKKI